MALNKAVQQPMALSAPTEREPELRESKDGEATLRPRYYQLEMLEESMKRNIIVAMDTGSGKSLIAVLRIQEELDRASAEKFIFVLVPTVALAAQWHSVISAQLPAIQSRFLSGADGVDRWSDQRIWDEFLQEVRVVVCTYQILLDTMVHGFIRMSGLALVVFDEAHHCMASHPANRIMRDFYHTTESNGRPAILGLTASPQTKGKTGDLERVESNIDAIARTPRLHRDELLRHVVQPELIKLQYSSTSTDTAESAALQKLIEVYTNLDIEQDPYVVKLRADPSTRDSKQLKKALASGKTYCQDQLKSLCMKSGAIFEELGAWATQFYIYTSIEKFCSKTNVDDFLLLDALDDTEKLYLRKILRSIKSPNQRAESLQKWLHHESVQNGSSISRGASFSKKVTSLIDYLANVEVNDFRGIVFVKTRASCAVLEHILSTHPKTKDNFRVSTFVGMSSSPKKKFDMGELVDIKNQTDTLENFRSGQKNLVIATSVLEEGIDVSACNVVICFEKPPNLKAFIQRRGRARKSQSKYVIMFPEEDNLSGLATWQQLEDEMRQRYMDEMRRVEQLRTLEEADTGRREFFVESTGAKLMLEDAVQHLYHFCATLPSDPYVDLKPIFTFTEGFEGGPVRARVSLPNSVDSTLREACSPSEWVSEKLAKRDAAFEAYIALYHAGLVSDNLLPLRGHGDEDLVEAQSRVEKIVSLVEIDEQFSIWPLIAREWCGGSAMHTSTVLITKDRKPLVQMLMILPRPLSDTFEIDLYWDAFTALKATVDPGPIMPQNSVDPRAVADCTGLILRSVFEPRIDCGNTDFVAQFVPAEVKNLSAWHNQYYGAAAASTIVDNGLPINSVGILRDLTFNGVPHIFGGIEWIQPRCANDQLDGAMQSVQDDEVVESDLYIKARRLPKRADFLHPIPLQNRNQASLSSSLLRASDCMIDKLPFIYSQFALLIPSILHRVEVSMIADDLCKNVLPSVRFSNLSVVLTAISTTASQAPTNYQRLEFLGDSILKTFTSLTLLARHLNWHEGVLSHKKDHIVSNANLARATLARGLDRYILTKPFTGNKWRPLYVSNLVSDRAPAIRRLSTKTLADVVESLIGAAYLDGGESKALACLEALLPGTPWTPLDQLCQTLHTTYDTHVSLPPPYHPLETMISYAFKLPSLLLEAITHPSHHGPTPSYQRLEFVGDSILDRIVTITTFSHTPPIETHTLHLIRTALVNANFLAFCCLTLSTPASKTSITENPDGTLTSIETISSIALWKFMRHSSPAVRTAQAATNTRYQALKDPITNLLDNGDHYPWSLLAALEAPKFFSDIIESIIGAIYIDTLGSIPACEAFLEKLGLLGYLRRVMQRGEGAVAVKHPKEELGVVADTERVRYEVFRAKKEEAGDGRGKENRKEKEEEEEEEEEEEGKGELRCRVWVGERMVVEVGQGISGIEVETRGAEEAVRVLKAEKEEGMDIDEEEGGVRLE